MGNMHTCFSHFSLSIFNKSALTAGLLFTIFFSTVAPVPANQELTFKEYLKNANNHIKANQHFLAVDALKEANRLGGNQHPSLHMKLAILYYGLGLIPDAIIEGEKAVNLAPRSKWYKYDLAKFYLVDKQLNKAENEFNTLLKLDPGFTLAYYYLAEVYFQKKKYDMAWLSLTRACLLGHQGRRLLKKLSPLTSKPAENFENISNNNQLFRYIKLSTREKAEAILNDIKNGKKFHNLELEQKKDTGDRADFGIVLLSELKDSVAATLKNSTPYATPTVIQTGPDFRVMQRIASFDPQIWQDIVNSLPTDPDNSENNLSIKLSVAYALKNWQNSWQSADLNRYLSVYSKDFIPPENMSLTAWKKDRRKNLSQLKYIHIELINPVIEMLGQTRVVITFKQIYKTEAYHDLVMKTLIMKREKEKWKIISEQVTKTLEEGGKDKEG